MALLVEIANSWESGVATENIVFPFFINWGEFVSHLLFISVFEVDITFCVRMVNSFLKVRVKTILFPDNAF